MDLWLWLSQHPCSNRVACLMSSGRLCQMWGPKYEKVSNSKPWVLRLKRSSLRKSRESGKEGKA